MKGAAENSQACATSSWDLRNSKTHALFIRVCLLSLKYPSCTMFSWSVFKTVEDLDWNVLVSVGTGSWEEMEDVDSWLRLLFYGVDLHLSWFRQTNHDNIAVQGATPLCKALQNIAALFFDAMVHYHALVLSGTSTFLTAGTCIVEILTEDKYQQTYNISATIPVKWCLVSRAKLCHLARVIPLSYFYFYLAWIHTREVEQDFDAQNFEQPLMVVLPIFWVKIRSWVLVCVAQELYRKWCGSVSSTENLSLWIVHCRLCLCRQL